MPHLAEEQCLLCVEHMHRSESPQLSGGMFLSEQHQCCEEWTDEGSSITIAFVGKYELAGLTKRQIIFAFEVSTKHVKKIYKNNLKFKFPQSPEVVLETNLQLYRTI